MLADNAKQKGNTVISQTKAGLELVTLSELLASAVNIQTCLLTWFLLALVYRSNVSTLRSTLSRLAATCPRTVGRSSSVSGASLSRRRSSTSSWSWSPWTPSYSWWRFACPLVLWRRLAALPPFLFPFCESPSLCQTFYWPHSGLREAQPRAGLCSACVSYLFIYL